MIVAVVLVGYALAVSFGAPVLLRRASWPQRAPRLGIAMLLAACASVVLGLGLAGLALAVPTVAVSDGLSQWLQACVITLRAAYATPGGVILATTGASFALFVAARVVYAVVWSWATASRQRSVHRRAVTLAGHRRPGLDALVVDYEQAAAYCVPGRHGQVVLTTGALAGLTQAELAAVLAHERAHLRGRHHLVVGAVKGLAAAFPGIPLPRRDAQDRGHARPKSESNRRPDAYKITQGVRRRSFVSAPPS